MALELKDSRKKEKENLTDISSVSSSSGTHNDTRLLKATSSFSHIRNTISTRKEEQPNGHKAQ
jgi:hypothetical protein